MPRPRVPDQSNSVLTVPTQIVLLYGFGALCVQFWVTQVCKTVPEPYLDEVFHIPQAQVYWAGSWRTWDPKITTPPGLYIYSCLFAKFLVVFGKRGLSVCLLRTSISLLLMLTPVVSLRCHPRYHRYQDWPPMLFFQIMHANLNIILCPLLFFFSALYYTDVLSAFTVSEVYRWYVYLDSQEGKGSYLLSRLSADARSMICRIAIFCLGLYAMLVRQTNVFWVTVFLGGLQVMKTLSSRTRPRRSVADQQSPVSMNANVIYDPPMRDAGIEAYGMTVLSLISIAPRHIPQLVGDLVPYLAMLATFVGFVIWNGGVVLGDRENHVASIHLPQMLYIWPCIVFFSWPVLLPCLTNLSRKLLPRLRVALALMVLMLLVVHFNTIVHPFTLADNRHYVFYVFRILLRNPIIKYAAVPVYFICAWLVITAMTDVFRDRDPILQHTSKQEESLRETSESLFIPEEPTHVSFVLIWLSATTLSLVTAPLVEPRYFIVPWLVWRMNIPVEPQWKENCEPNRTGGNRIAGKVLSWVAPNWLWIETAWYLLINLITCYVFLYKGFVWPQEPGKVQRFMW